MLAYEPKHHSVQWPKLCTGFDVEREIQILKGLVIQQCSECQRVIVATVASLYTSEALLCRRVG